MVCGEFTIGVVIGVIIGLIIGLIIGGVWVGTNSTTVDCVPARRDDIANLWHSCTVLVLWLCSFPRRVLQVNKPVVAPEHDWGTTVNLYGRC